MLFNDIVLQLIKENDLDIDITSKDNFSIFEEVVNAGVSQKEIITRFETKLNVPFVDIMKKEPDYSFIKKYSLDKIESIKIFPYTEEGILKIAIFEEHQIDFLDNMIGNAREYVPVFCFDFLIEQKLDEVADILEQTITSNIGKEVVEINANRKSVLLATGQDSIDTIIESSPVFKSDLYVLDKLHRRELICEKCEELNPEILLVGDNIGGKAPLIKILMRVVATCPTVRIIFLCGKVNPGDDVMQANLGLLASVGVFDIIADSEISISKLQHVINNPQGEDDVKHFIEKIKDSSGKKTSSEIVITIPEEVETEDTIRLYENLYAFVSPHGSVGKSTILQNLAITLDKHAMPNINNKKPKIAIIDLDFQGFSTSRFFDTINKDKNIYTAIDNAAKLIDELGNMRELSKVEQSEINEKIHSSFVQTKKYKNIYVLGGDDKVYSKGDKNRLNSFLLTYIIESIISDFDIILVDANTDIECSVIFPLYQMARTIFNVMDVSTQCFNLNKRYLTYLEDVSVYNPINNKFILNKTFDLTESYLSLKDIKSALKIDFDYIFPKIPDQMMFNLSCKNESLIEPDEPELNLAKAEFYEMANDIITLKNFDELNEKLALKASQRFKKKDKSKEQSADDKSNKDSKKSGFITNFMNKTKKDKDKVKSKPDNKK